MEKPTDGPSHLLAVLIGRDDARALTVGELIGIPAPVSCLFIRQEEMNTNGFPKCGPSSKLLQPFLLISGGFRGDDAVSSAGEGLRKL